MEDYLISEELAALRIKKKITSSAEIDNFSNYRSGMFSVAREEIQRNTTRIF
jgi:hypothetical protein